MKTTTLGRWMAVGLSVLVASVVFRASAYETATAAAAIKEKTHTGTVMTVDPQEHRLQIKGWTQLNQKFTLGESCTYVLLDKPAGTMRDLHPGQKVEVTYQDAHGVLIAAQVKQVPMQVTGTVRSVDPALHSMKVRVTTFDKHYRLADDVRVTLHHDRPGTLADLKPGHHVTLTYETPDGKPVVRLIAQASKAYNGPLTAIDLSDRTLKSKGMFGTKKFHIADNCTVVLAGKPDAGLTDLKPGDLLTFSYDEVNGVNVVNRIATQGEGAIAAAPQTTF